MKILMVCLGNICRSPLAEGILKNKLLERGLDWTVDSAGTGFWHIGDPPDPRAVSTAGKYGLDISRQRARQIQYSDLQDYDLILAMDSSNYQDILRLADNGRQKSKVEMILNYVDPGSNRNVPDPYWNDDGFDQVFKMLEEACDKVIEKHL